MITVVLPIGPFKDDLKYHDECLESLRLQTMQPNQIIYVLDGHKNVPASNGMRRIIMYNLWRLGCAASWNIGVGASETECCFLMSADDWLEHTALEKCWEAYQHRGAEPLGYYYLGVKYFPSGEIQELPCNAAMVTKSLWAHTGGFPPEAGLGAPDALLISILLGQRGRAGYLYKVSDEPLYNVRTHEGQETRRTGKYHQQIIDVRNIATATWEPPTWGQRPLV